MRFEQRDQHRRYAQNNRGALALEEVENDRWVEQADQ